MLKKDRVKMRTNSNKLAKKYDWKNIAMQFRGVFKDMVIKNLENRSKKEGER